MKVEKNGKNVKITRKIKNNIGNIWLFQISYNDNENKTYHIFFNLVAK